MIFIKSFLIALSTYSIIPVPQFDWNEKNMKNAICFFPIVGILCGGVLFGWYAFCRTFDVSNFLFAVIAVCIPIIFTGGIHMDGYMDTVDALSSHQPRERKLEILKDSHCGAFSVIYCIIYLLLDIAFFYELFNKGNVTVVCPVFVLSRAMSVLYAVNMPNARKSGMLNAYTENTERKRVNASMAGTAIISAAVILFISPVSGAISVCFGLVFSFFYRRMVIKQFGGVTGDTAGFFLQVFELSCIAGTLIGALIK